MPDNHIQKPPYSTEAEQAVLGGVMLDAEAFGRATDEGLRAEHFFAQAHRDIWQAMQVQVDAGQPVDVVTLSEQIERLGRLDEMGGVVYLVELTQSTPSAANVASYAGIILQRAHERLWVATLQAAHDGFYDPTVANPVARAEALLLTLDGHDGAFGKGVGLMPLRTAIDDFITLKEDQHQNPGMRGLQTGYHNIDHRLNGLQAGNLMVVGARPGMGKTNYLLNIMRQVGFQKHAYEILIFSLEMNNSEIVQRLVGAQGEVKGDLLKSAKVFEHDASLVRMSQALGELKGLRVQLCDAASLTVAEIAAMTRTVHRRSSVGLVLIDYLGLVDVDGRMDTQALRIAEITRALKKLAKEVLCPVIIAAQLSRKVEERRDKRPVLSDLRDSGAIEQDADVVQFLYRDEYYYPDSTQRPGQVEVISAKIRDGVPGTDYLGWQGQYYRMNSQSTFDQDGPGGSGGGESWDYE